MQVTADSILRLTRVPAAGYRLRLTQSHGWLEFLALDTSYSWLQRTADSSSGCWIRLKDDSIHPAAISSFGGLIKVAGDSILRLTRVLYFNTSSKFKDLFCKIHHFYGLFSTDWFQLQLIQALAAAWRTLKKLEEAWRNFKTLAATDSICSSRFELLRLIRDLRLPEVWPRLPLIFVIHY